MQLLMIISLCICFYTRIGISYEINYFIRIIIASIWTLLFILKAIKNNLKLTKNQLIFLFPVIVITLYNLFLILIGDVELQYIGRLVSNVYSMLITVTFALSVLYFFKEKSFLIVTYAVILNFISLILINFCLYGFNCFISLYQSIIGNINAANPFEIHDLTFAVGILFIIFLLHKNEVQKWQIAIMFIIMFLGFKRIQLLTLFLCLIIYGIYKLIPNKNKFNFMVLITILLFAFSFIYVVMIKTGLLASICNSLGIQTMGRLSLYQWISQYFELSLLYLGLGTGITFKMAETLTNWGIAALHSDILRMYVEIGFVGFFFWLFYYLIYNLFYVKRNFNLNILSSFFFATIYLFMLHFTDNTVLYFATQFIYVFSLTYLFIYKKILFLNNHLENQYGVDKYES